MIACQLGESMSTPPQNVQKTIRLSSELWLLAEQAISNGQFRSINDFLRACVRAYIDETGDILGSRRYFNNRMGQRMDRLEATVLWGILQNQMLMARGLFTILDELSPEDAEAEPPNPEEQMARANEASKRFLARFLEEQSPVIAQLEQYLGKKNAAKHDKPKAAADKPKSGQA